MAAGTLHPTWYFRPIAGASPSLPLFQVLRRKGQWDPVRRPPGARFHAVWRWLATGHTTALDVFPGAPPIPKLSCIDPPVLSSTGEGVEPSLADLVVLLYGAMSLLHLYVKGPWY